MNLKIKNHDKLQTTLKQLSSDIIDAILHHLKNAPNADRKLFKLNISIGEDIAAKLVAIRMLTSRTVEVFHWENFYADWYKLDHKKTGDIDSLSRVEILLSILKALELHGKKTRRWVKDTPGLLY